jgi:adenylate cyclase
MERSGADVVGYSRLMGDDDRATLETLTAYRQVMQDRIGEHGGRVVDSPGDALLAEFSSPVEALRAAVEIQRDLGQRNSLLPETRKMQVRPG